MALSPSESWKENRQTVFRLRTPVEPDHQNGVTSTFGVLGRDNNSGQMTTRALRSRRGPYKSSPRELYRGMSSFKLQPSRTFNLPDTDTISISNLNAFYSCGDNSTKNFSGSSKTVCTLVNNDVSHRVGGNPGPVNTIAEIETRVKLEPMESGIYSHTLLQPIQVSIPRASRNPWPTAYKRQTRDAYTLRGDFV